MIFKWLVKNSNLEVNWATRTFKTSTIAYLLSVKNCLSQPCTNPFGAVSWTPCCIWKANESLMKLSITERMSVLLQLDISGISQPSHRRCSESAMEGRSRILTKLLLKAVGHSLANELGDIPDLVFDENRPNVIILTYILQIFPHSGILFTAHSFNPNLHGVFDYLFYMRGGGGGKKAPWSNSGIRLSTIIKLGIIILWGKNFLNLAK